MVTEEETRPVRRRRHRPQPRKKLRWGRIILLLLILVLLLGGIGFGSYQLYRFTMAKLYPATVTENTLAEQSPPPQVPKLALEQKSLDKPIYILLIGKDTLSSPQADAVFLLSINEVQNSVDIIGIPSNSKIVGRDKKTVQMFNTLYSVGGVELTRAVVEDMFHISVPYYVVVGQFAFTKTVDVFGAHNLYVEKNMEHYDENGQADIWLKQGYQSLNGEKALQYMRYIDSDTSGFGRVQRQERFLKNFVEQQQKTMTLSNMWHVWRVWDRMETNISSFDMVKLVWRLRNVLEDHIRYYVLPGTVEQIKQEVYWDIDPTEVQRLVGITIGNEEVTAESKEETASSNKKKSTAVENTQNGKNN